MKIRMIVAMVMLSLVSMAQEDSVSVERDTTRIELKKLEILIIGKEEDKGLELCLGADSTDFDDGPDKADFSKWGGLELYANTYLTPAISENDKPYTLPSNQRSIGVNFNFMEEELPLIKNNLLLSSGLGIQFNHYSYDRDTVGISAAQPTFQNFEYSVQADGFKKQNINLTYLTLPVLLQFNSNGVDPEKGFHVAAGVVGAWNIRAKSKHKYMLDGNKVKNSIDFHDVEPLKLNAVARVGYGNFVFFASYGITSFNKFNVDSDGNELADGLHTIEAGIRLIDF